MAAQDQRQLFRIATSSKHSDAHLARLKDAIEQGTYDPAARDLAERMPDPLEAHENASEPSTWDARTILLVEDNDDDADLIERALDAAALINPWEHLYDGAACVEWLAKCSPETLPVVVLLDLRLPKIDGLGVLGHIREQPSLALLPVIIMTSSNHDEDRLSAMSMRIDAFLRKPIDVASFLRALETAGVTVSSFESIESLR